MRRIAVIALIYVGLGLLGLALALPPGYASPVFPAAGFAVAIMLCSKRRAWPGIVLGSLLLNLGTGDLDGAARIATLLTALGIAVGSTLQAHAAAVLIERLAGRSWQKMESVRDIVRILFVAGPLACLISASIGVTTLVLNGLTPAADISFTWWIWWTGDVLGVLVALPLSLAVLLRAHRPWHTRQVALGLPMLIALSVIAAGYVAVAQWERTGREQEVRRHGEQLARQLEERFIAHQEALAALKRLIEVTPEMSYAQFDHFTRITLRENPDIFALSFNPYVRHAEREAIELRMGRATETPDFRIRERDARKQLVRAAERPDYVVVGYIAPLEGNRPAIGYDINSEPVRQDAIRRARESQHLSITSTIQLVQENQQRVGALLLYPAYRTASRHETIPSDSDLMGFAVGVIKLDQMVQIATDPLRIPGLAFRIDDVSDGQSSLVFRSDGAVSQPPGALLKIPLEMADRTWELSVFPTASYQPENRPWVAWATGVVGLLLAELLQMLLLVTTGQTAVTERKMHRQSAELQDRSALINTLFELSPDGFVAIAADGTIRLSNPAFHTMTGIPAAEVVGRSIGNLDGLLFEHADKSEHFTPLESLFGVGISGSRRLALARPHAVVLQVVGVRSHAASIDRFVYFRDVTHETEVDRMKSEFLSHAAHELRTPMASIYGFSELLITQDFDAETRKDLLTTIYKQTAWLIEIINELLDLSRIESRRGRDFKIAAVPLWPLVAEVLDAMKIDPARWPVVLDPPAEPPLVLADAAKLRQVLTNVLGNAVKYSPGGGAIAIRGAVHADPAKPMAGIVVADRGIGMTPEQTARVCERFYRADTSGSIPGSGLGMSIVKEVLDLLGGRLDIASAPATGTSVTLWLPVAMKAVPGAAARKGSS